MFHREITAKILPWLGTNKVIILKGARRAGKTEVLRDLVDFIDKRGERSVFLSAEQKRHSPFFSSSSAFLQYLKDQYGLGSGKKLYVFIDEFQYIKNSGHFIKELYDAASEHLELIVAASTAFQLIKTHELKDIRKIFYVRRLSFVEYLNTSNEFCFHQKFEMSDEKSLKSFYKKYKGVLDHSASLYMQWGGYPEVVQENDTVKKMEVLGDIIHGYVEKDISSFLRVENVEAYLQLMKALSSEVGNLLNHQELSVKLKIHKKTLKKYIDILHGTYAFSFIPPYFTNIKKELAKMNTVYAFDLGLTSYFLQQQCSKEKKHLSPHSRIKNFIFCELQKHGFEKNLFFYRTIAKAEIDFILCRGNQVLPIKVKFGKKGQPVPVVVKNFMKTYSDVAQKAIILTEDELRFEKECIFIPVSLFPFLKID